MGFEVSIIIFRCLWILQIQFLIKFQSSLNFRNMCCKQNNAKHPFHEVLFWGALKVFGGLWKWVYKTQDWQCFDASWKFLVFQSTRIFRGGQGLFCSYAHQNWILNPLLYCAVPICNLLSPWKYRLIKIIQRTAHEGKTTRISWGPCPVVPVHCSGSQVPVTGGHKLTCPVVPGIRWRSYHHLTFSRRYQVDLVAAGWP